MTPTALKQSVCIWCGNNWTWCPSDKCCEYRFQILSIFSAPCHSTLFLFFSLFCFYFCFALKLSKVKDQNGLLSSTSTLFVFLWKIVKSACFGLIFIKFQHLAPRSTPISWNPPYASEWWSMFFIVAFSKMMHHKNDLKGEEHPQT